MKNKTLIILTCHCDTDKKLKVLEDTIKRLKQFNFDILVISHIPVPFKIQQMVEYFIFDKSNPILLPPLRLFRFWNTRAHPTKDGKILRLEANLPDYGWTVFNQFIKSSEFALDLDYEYYSFVNYDIELNDDLIGQLGKPKHSFICSKVIDSNGDERWPSLIFNIIKKENLKTLIPSINLEDYINKPNGKEAFDSAEHYWRVLIARYNYHLYEDVIKDKIDFGTPFIFNQNIHNDSFRIFFEKSNKPKYLARLFKEEVTLHVNDKSYILDSTEHIGKLPKKINKLGYTLKNSEYFDLLEEYNSSTNHLFTEYEA